MSPSPTSPPTNSPLAQLPRQRRVIRRGRTWKDWVLAIVMLTLFCWGAWKLIAAARTVPGFGYFFLALAVLAFLFDILMLLRGRSMVLVIGAIFAGAAVMTFIPDLALGVPLAVVTIAAYAGGMLLIAFRKRA